MTSQATHICRGIVFGSAMLLAATMAVAEETETEMEMEAETATTQLDFELERVDNGFAITPDFKIADVDGSAESLAGVYGGFIQDHHLLIGGGGYWLASGNDNLEMWYGGGVVEWFSNRSGLFQLSLRGLVGGGSATLGTEVEIPGRGFHFDHRRGFRGAPTGSFETTTAIVGVNRMFFITEPQANLFVNLADWCRLGIGGSYRAIAGAGSLTERLRGPSASISLQLGSF